MRQLFAVLVGLCLGTISNAQIFLKPTEGSYESLREKSVQVDSVIDRGLAETTLTIVFANQQNSRIEADFIYTLRPGMRATAFAYWYGSEKVAAQIVEKERAAEIYKAITTRQRDPALVELIGKRTFRARIFPVMPNADLKVEIKMVQPLVNGATIELPIKLPKGEILDSLNIHAQLRNRPDGKIISNYPVEGSVADVHFNASNYRPEQDLRLSLKLASKPIRAALFAAPSGSAVGFFALTINGAKWGPSKLVAPGIQLSQLWPPSVPHLKPNQDTLIVGRYTGSGMSDVALVDRSGKRLDLGRFLFSGQPEPNNLATKLWAAEKLEHFGNGSRKQMVELSERFGIPSKATSWLAIPNEERERYHREKNMADLNMAIKKYIRAIADGNPYSVELAEASRLSKVAGYPLDYAIPTLVYDVATEFTSDYGKEAVAGRYESREAKNALSRVHRIEAYFKTPRLVEQCLANTTAFHEAADQAADDVREGNTGQQAREHLVALGRWAKLLGVPARQLLTNELTGDIYSLARKIVEIRYGQTPLGSGENLSELAQKFHRLEAAVNEPKGQTYRAVYQQFFDAKLQTAYMKANQIALKHPVDSPEVKEAIKEYFQVSDQAHYTKLDRSRAISRSYAEWETIQPMVEAIRTGDLDSDRLKEAYRRLQLFEKTFELSFDAELASSAQNVASQVAYGLAWQEQLIKRDPAQINDLENQLERLSKVGHFDPAKLREKIFREVTERGSARARYEYIQALRDPSTPKSVLSNRRQALVDADFKERGSNEYWQTWINNHPKRIEVQVELDQLEHEPQTDATKQRIEMLKAKDSELRGQWGDPLVTSNSPKDAQMVVTKLPDGTMKRLEWNAENHRWEARFEIPAYAKEGNYSIPVITVLKDGVRKSEVFTYVVDMTPPTGSVKLLETPNGLRIFVECSSDVARAEAVMPDGRSVSLTKVRDGNFATTVSMPSELKFSVRVVLIDKAHNVGEGVGRFGE